MESEPIRDVLGQLIIKVDDAEYDALVAFARFMQDREYGEFTAVINTDRRTGHRDILINITNKQKISLKTVQQTVVTLSSQ